MTPARNIHHVKRFARFTGGGAAASFPGPHLDFILNPWLFAWPLSGHQHCLYCWLIIGLTKAEVEGQVVTCIDGGDISTVRRRGARVWIFSLFWFWSCGTSAISCVTRLIADVIRSLSNEWNVKVCSFTHSRGKLKCNASIYADQLRVFGSSVAICDWACKTAEFRSSFCDLSASFPIVIISF